MSVGVSPRRIAAATAAVAVVAFASFVGGTCGCTTPSFGGGGSGTANIWVDATGGTCTRSPSAGTYSDAAACGSLDAANDVCQNGDTVRIVSLNGSQTVSGTDGRTSDCLVKPQTDGTPVSLNGAVSFDATSGRMTVTGLHQTIDTPDYLNVLSITGSNLTFNDVAATRFDANSGANTVLIENSSFGPCISSYGTGGAGTVGSNGGVCNNRVLDTATNVTVQDSTLHGNGQTWDGVSGTNGQPPHSECLAIFGSINFTLQRSKLYDCGDSANTLIQANPGTGQKATNLSFIGNWFNVAWNATDGTFTNEKCTGIDLRTADIAGSFNFSWNTLNRCTGTEGGLEIPWVSTNSGDGLRYAASLTSARFVGNIGTTVAGGGGGGCPTNSGSNVIDYNVQIPWSGTLGVACGSNATTLAASQTQPFLTDQTKHGAFDFHLFGTTQSWENAVPTSVAGGCPIDIDGQSRPIGAACDPGSDER